jgi:hypothetical protein
VHQAECQQSAEARWSMSRISENSVSTRRVCGLQSLGSHKLNVQRTFHSWRVSSPFDRRRARLQKKLLQIATAPATITTADTAAIAGQCTISLQDLAAFPLAYLQICAPPKRTAQGSWDRPAGNPPIQDAQVTSQPTSAPRNHRRDPLPGVKSE